MKYTQIGNSPGRYGHGFWKRVPSRNLSQTTARRSHSRGVLWDDSGVSLTDASAHVWMHDYAAAETGRYSYIPLMAISFETSIPRTFQKIRYITEFKRVHNEPLLNIIFEMMTQPPHQAAWIAVAVADSVAAVAASSPSSRALIENSFVSLGYTKS